MTNIQACARSPGYLRTWFISYSWQPSPAYAKLPSKTRNDPALYKALVYTIVWGFLYGWVPNWGPTAWHGTARHGTALHGTARLFGHFASLSTPRLGYGDFFVTPSVPRYRERGIGTRPKLFEIGPQRRLWLTRLHCLWTEKGCTDLSRRKIRPAAGRCALR